jgi:selenide,water dikinase
MATLNRAAAEAMDGMEIHACTDITGFGLLGHLREMAAGSKVDVALSAGAVPVLPEADGFAAADVVPGGTLNNLEYVEPHVDFAKEVPRVRQILLADAQTSGGLLISLPAKDADELLARLKDKGVKDAALVGHVTAEGAGRITVEA